jgi:phospholipid/cholesterol/gamma-HCH transport system substrate-binding protein
MQLEYSRKEKIVGMFIIAVVALLLSTIVMIGRGQNWFKKHITYYTTFDESYNLQTNAAVKLFKTDIGKVDRITLVENRVRVTMEILEEYAPRIRKDSIASVESPTFIGDEYVSIKPGSQNKPMIREGGEIPSTEKKSLTQVLEEFEIEKTSKMMIKAFQDFSVIISELRDPDGPLFLSLNNLNRIIGDVEAGKGTLGSIVKSRELIDDVIERLDQLDDILRNIDKAAGKAPETMDNINKGLSTIQQAGNGVVERIDDVERILKEVEGIVGQLKIVIRNLEEGSHDVPEITRNTKIGIQEIRDGVKRIDSVFQAAEKNILIRSNLPPEPAGKRTDAELRR